VLVSDPKAPKFSLNVPLYTDQLRKDLAVNVYKGGQWGTYRHLPLEESNDVQALHAFMNITVRGDLSSLAWIQGNITDIK
jgi:fatty acid synthase